MPGQIRLSSDVVVNLANERHLSRRQTEVLIRRVIEDKSYEQIALEINTSPNAVQKCLGEVYRKFDIEGDTKGKEEILVEILRTYSRPYELNELSGEKLINKFENLIEQGQEGEINTNELAKILPSLIDAVARESKEPRGIVYQKFLASLGFWYKESSKIRLSPTLLKNFGFIIQADEEKYHPISRSIFAFIARLLKQLQLDSIEPYQILSKAIPKILLDYENGKLGDKNGKNLRNAPSALLRKFCLEELEEILKSTDPEFTEKESIQVELSVTEDCLNKNIKIIGYILEKFKENDFETYNIWRHIYEYGHSYEQMQTGEFYELKSLSVQRINELEIKALRFIRSRYHEVIGDKNIENNLQEIDDVHSSRDIATDIMLYGELARYKSLNFYHLGCLKLILQRSISLPIIDFWINEIDHFIAHERTDLIYVDDSHKEFEQEQRIKLQKFLRENYSCVDGEEESEFNLVWKDQKWQLKNYRVYTEKKQGCQVEMTWFNDESKAEFLEVFFGEEGLIDTMCEVINRSVKQAFKSISKFFLCWTNLKSDKVSTEVGGTVNFSVIIQHKDNFYVGQYQDKDSTKAILGGCISAVKKMLENNPTNIKNMVDENILPHKIKISEKARISTTQECLEVLVESGRDELYAVTSGEFVNWWNSKIGQDYLEFNQVLIRDKNVKIHRIFICENLSEEVKEVLSKQEECNIDVHYICQNDNNSIDQTLWKDWSKTNFVIYGEKLMAEKDIELQMKKGGEDGFISFNYKDIHQKKQKFDEMLKYSQPWLTKYRVMT